MPHNSSFKWDVDQANNMHVLFTSHLPQSDIRKFSKRCPSEISRAIVRLLDPIAGIIPKLYRIVHDIHRVLYCIEEIVKAGGAVVPALVNRNGHRAKGTGRGRHYIERNANKVIASLSDIGIFTDVQEVAKEFVKEQKTLFEKHIKNSQGVPVNHAYSQIFETLPVFVNPIHVSPPLLFLNNTSTG
jgi:hypothetical protein